MAISAKLFLILMSGFIEGFKVTISHTLWWPRLFFDGSNSFSLLFVKGHLVTISAILFLILTIGFREVDVKVSYIGI